MANVLADDLDQTVHTSNTPVVKRFFTLFSEDESPVYYRIDLTDDNFKTFEEALAPFMDVAHKPEAGDLPNIRRTGAPARETASGDSRKGTSKELAEKRAEQRPKLIEWVEAQNKDGATYSVPRANGQGRLSQDMIDAFYKDNSDLEVVFGTKS